MISALLLKITGPPNSEIALESDPPSTLIDLVKLPSRPFIILIPTLSLISSPVTVLIGVEKISSSPVTELSFLLPEKKIPLSFIAE